MWLQERRHVCVQTPTDVFALQGQVVRQYHGVAPCPRTAHWRARYGGRETLLDVHKQLFCRLDPDLHIHLGEALGVQQQQSRRPLRLALQSVLQRRKQCDLVIRAS